MRRLGLVLSLLAALGLGPWAWMPVHAQVGPPNTIQCNKSAGAAPSTATTTSLVSGVAGVSLAICGWHVTSSVATDNSFQFVYGTQGGPCGSPVNLTPIGLHVINSAPSSDHIESAWASVPAGAQLCVVTSAATALQVVVYYAALQ